MLAGACVWLVPSLFIEPARQSLSLGVAQIVAGGVLVGIGRQGADILAIRLFGAALGEIVGILLVLTAKHETVCQGLQGCFRDTVLGVGVFAVLLAAIMAFIALPTTILWSHGIEGLTPELRWPWPSSWGQWVIVAIVGAVLFFGTLFVLGIPLSAP